MDKFLFFDIDGTLFDPKKFLDSFYSELNQFGIDDKENLNALYQKVKLSEGHFIPKSFFNLISQTYTQTSAEVISKVFWNVDLFDRSVYEDTSVLPALQKNYILGIFSTGDVEFQKHKITTLNFFDDENVFVFPEKLDHIEEVFAKFEGKELYYIDNALDVLQEIKKLIPGMKEILIDRNNKWEDKQELVRITSFTQLHEIL
jgi:phosphoglycolate phosphatase-like HAD superfamily hydrolase